MIDPNAADEASLIRRAVQVSSAKIPAKNCSPPARRSRVNRAIPGKQFVRLALDPARVAADDDAVVPVCDAPDNAPAGGVGRAHRIGRAPASRGPGRIDRTEGAAEFPPLSVGTYLEFGCSLRNFPGEDSAEIRRCGFIPRVGRAVPALVFERRTRRPSEVSASQLPIPAQIEEVMTRRSRSYRSGRVDSARSQDNRRSKIDRRRVPGQPTCFTEPQSASFVGFRISAGDIQRPKGRLHRFRDEERSFRPEPRFRITPRRYPDGPEPNRLTPTGPDSTKHNRQTDR